MYLLVLFLGVNHYASAYLWEDLCVLGTDNWHSQTFVHGGVLTSALPYGSIFSRDFNFAVGTFLNICR